MSSAAERLIGGAKRAQMELLEEALADPAGVDINAKDGIGNTALHYAALFGHGEVVERLLSCGANPNAKNRCV